MEPKPLSEIPELNDGPDPDRRFLAMPGDVAYRPESDDRVWESINVLTADEARAALYRIAAFLYHDADSNLWDLDKVWSSETIEHVAQTLPPEVILGVEQMISEQPADFGDR